MALTIRQSVEARLANTFVVASPMPPKLPLQKSYNAALRIMLALLSATKKDCRTQMTPAVLTPEETEAICAPITDSSYAAFQKSAIQTAEEIEATQQLDLQNLSNAKPKLSAEQVRQQVKQDLRMGREYQEGRVNWITTIVMGLFHVMALAALFCFSWKNLAAFAITYFFAINIGIGVAYHRLLTHRGFRTPKWVEYFVTACGTMALEGGPIFWVATHRVHHQNSDQEGDPHTPVDGTFWAHAGWILSGRAMHSETTLLGRYAPDLTRDKGHVWLSRFHWLPLTLDRLRPDWHRRRAHPGSSLLWRNLHADLGNFPPRRRRPACHLVRQLGHAPLRRTPLRDA